MSGRRASPLASPRGAWEREILPGDGDLPLGAIVERLRQIDYRGPVSLELLNPQLWRIPARQLGEIGMTALRKVLGQATMGGR